MGVSDGPPLDIDRIVQVLDRHQVDYLMVGGGAARTYGAQRLTQDVDCVPRPTADNLDRLSAAMRELNARLDVEGLSDEEAKALPVQLDARALGDMQISTWMTDAGGLDVLNSLDHHGQAATTDQTEISATADRLMTSTSTTFGNRT